MEVLDLASARLVDPESERVYTTEIASKALGQLLQWVVSRMSSCSSTAVIDAGR